MIECRASNIDIVGKLVFWTGLLTSSVGAITLNSLGFFSPDFEIFTLLIAFIGVIPCAFIFGIPVGYMVNKALEYETPKMKRQAVKQSVLEFVEFARKTK